LERIKKNRKETLWSVVPLVDNSFALTYYENMTHLTHVLFAKEGSSFDLNLISDGILAIFTGTLTSKFATHFISQIEDQYHLYNDAGVGVYFATQDSLESNSKAVLLDPQNEFGLQCPIVGKYDQQCNALMVFEKKGNGPI
jgi:hypothetical protein